MHEIRRKLPRYHWRPLVGIRAGEALADLQRIALALRDPAADELRARRQDARAGRLDRARARPAARPDRAAGGGRARGDAAARRSAGSSRTPCSRTSTRRSSRSRGCRAASATSSSELEHGTLKVGIEPTGLDELEHALRSVANRIGAAIIIVGLLISSALIARVNDGRWRSTGFSLAAALGLYMLWKIIRTPGEL